MAIQLDKEIRDNTFQLYKELKKRDREYLVYIYRLYVVVDTKVKYSKITF